MEESVVLLALMRDLEASTVIFADALTRLGFILAMICPYFL